MVKTHTTVTVDIELVEEARRLNINVSGAFNEFLEGLLAKYNEDVEGINIRLERIRITKLTNQLNHIQTQLKNGQSLIARWEKIQQDKEENKLQEEKETIENAMKCINCGKIMEEQMKSHKFNKGHVCHSCFMSASKESIKGWNDD